MGSFIGHVGPGSFFLVFGVWWTSQVWRLYLRSLCSSAGKCRGKPFSCRPSYPPSCCRRLNLEGVVVVVFGVAGVIAEFVTSATWAGGGGFAVSNGHHVSMYIAFTFLGLLGLLAPLLRRLFPTNTDDILYVAMIYAFSVEAILFKFHLMGRDPLNTLIHTLLLYSIYGCICTCLLELKYRHHPLITLSRAFFVTLQGTWFWQVAFILFNPLTASDNWDHEDHHHLMFAVVIYTWHIGGILVCSLCCGGAWYYFFSRRGKFSDVELLESKSNGHTHLLSDADLRGDSTDTEL